MIPDTLKFLFVVAAIGSSLYGSVWALSNFPPEQAEIIKSLPHERLRVR
jgi:hypothetical protein